MVNIQLMVVGPGRTAPFLMDWNPTQNMKSSNAFQTHTAKEITLFRDQQGQQQTSVVLYPQIKRIPISGQTIKTIQAIYQHRF